MLDGVHAIFSVLTGVSSNAKGPQQAQNDNSVRPGIGYIINYSPTETTTHEKILDVFQQTGLTDTPFEPVVKAIGHRPNNNNNDTNPQTDGATIVSQCCTVFKDHSSEYVKDLLKCTMEYCQSAYPDVTVCPTPACLTVVNPTLRDVLARSYKELCGAGIGLSSQLMSSGSAVTRTYNTAPQKGVNASMDVLLKFTDDQGLAIR